MTARQVFRFCLQASNVSKNFFNSTLVTPFFLTKNKCGYDLTRLLGSISGNKLKAELNNNYLVEKKSIIRNFTTTSTKLDETSDLNSTGKLKSKASSLVQSILHGSPAIREEEKQTHSKLIARGKYVHELQSIFIFKDLVKN